MLEEELALVELVAAFVDEKLLRLVEAGSVLLRENIFRFSSSSTFSVEFIVGEPGKLPIMSASSSSKSL